MYYIYVSVGALPTYRVYWLYDTSKISTRTVAANLAILSSTFV